MEYLSIKQMNIEQLISFIVVHFPDEYPPKETKEGIISYLYPFNLFNDIDLNIREGLYEKVINVLESLHPNLYPFVGNDYVEDIGEYLLREEESRYTFVIKEFPYLGSEPYFQESYYYPDLGRIVYRQILHNTRYPMGCIEQYRITVNDYKNFLITKKKEINETLISFTKSVVPLKPSKEINNSAGSN
jgi:hypothetical protein